MHVEGSTFWVALILVQLAALPTLVLAGLPYFAFHNDQLIKSLSQGFEHPKARALSKALSRQLNGRTRANLSATDTRLKADKVRLGRQIQGE